MRIYFKNQNLNEIKVNEEKIHITNIFQKKERWKNVGREELSSRLKYYFTLYIVMTMRPTAMDVKL